MKILRFATVLSLLLAFAGCIKVDQNLKINKDGSGTLDLQYSMSEQMIRQMEAMANMEAGQTGAPAPEKDNPFEFDEQSVREQLAEYEDQGITVKSVKTETANGWKTMMVELAFENLKDLSQTDFFKGNLVSLRKNDAGNYVFAQTARESGQSGPMGGPDANPAMLEQMAPMFAGMRIAQHVQVPGKIIESNATQTEGQVASWIFDVDEDPQVLSKIQDLDMQVEFSGQGVDLPDMNF